MRIGIGLALLLTVLLCGCTDWGAWDYFRANATSGDGGEPTPPPPDVLDTILGGYSFDSAATPGTDDSGNGMDGVLSVPPPTWVNDVSPRGGTLEFNGTNNYIALPSLNTGALAFSIMAWIRLASLGTVDGVYSTEAFAPRGVRFYIAANSKLGIEIEGNVPTTTATSFVFGPGDIGQWFHVAAAYDKTGARVKLYVNGQVEANDSLTTTVDAKLGSARIGGHGGLPLVWFHGRLDDVRLYDHALSDAEVAQVYDATK